MKLENARVLVVGGSSGIGFTVAGMAIAKGAKVTIASSNAERLSAAAQRLGPVSTAQMDVTDEGDVERAFKVTSGFDHIVFTAGDWDKARRDPITEFDREAAEQSFNVRFWGALNVVKYGVPILDSKGSIALTGGMTAHRPQRGTVIGTALSGSLEFTTRALAVELAPIRVNAVCPGPTQTEAWDKFPPGLHKQAEKHVQTQLLKRIASPDEIAVAYMYLMYGTYTTGQILYVEGGSLLGH